MQVLTIITGVFTFLMTCLCFYQAVYIAVSLFCKPKTFGPGKPNRFAVLISARNEEKVIGYLLDSIAAQDYPKELFDVYVVADNCTDRTAEVARAHGANVVERFNKEKRGKGYALDYLLHRIKEKYSGYSYYDGYLVVDADNLLDRNFITEINKVFSAGYRVVTSYRNSKNYEQCWESSGSALMLLRETLHLNNARMILGNSCTVGGTGFVTGHELIERMDGWNHYMLTEDIEFSLECVSLGVKIGYAHEAKLYDEQPINIKQLWNQRMRWSKGYLQAYFAYFIPLCRSFKLKGNKFSAYDMLMNNLPFMLLGIIGTILNLALMITGAVTGQLPFPVGFFGGLINALTGFDPGSYPLLVFGVMFIGFVLNMYLGGVFLGLLIAINAWKEIRCSTGDKVKSIFQFPLILAVIFATSIVAIFRPVEWKAIEHNGTMTIDDISKKKNK